LQEGKAGAGSFGTAERRLPGILRLHPLCLEKSIIQPDEDIRRLNHLPLPGKYLHHPAAKFRGDPHLQGFDCARESPAF